MPLTCNLIVEPCFAQSQTGNRVDGDRLRLFYFIWSYICLRFKRLIMLARWHCLASPRARVSGGCMHDSVSKTKQ